MKVTIGLSVVLLGITACATTQHGTSTGSGKNPDAYCREQGVELGTSAYQECVETYIHEQCTARDLEEGTDAYMQCAEDLREAGFLRQQLRIRGY